MNDTIVCRGCWSLGTACGECSRCRETAKRAVEEIRRWRNEAVAYEAKWREAVAVQGGGEVVADALMGVLLDGLVRHGFVAGWGSDAKGGAVVAQICGLDAVRYAGKGRTLAEAGKRALDAMGPKTTGAT